MKRFYSVSCLVLLLALFSATSYSQITLSGTISDSLTHEHLVGANVLLVGTSLGDAADVDGRFRIANVPKGAYQVRISYIGYGTKLISLGGNSDLNLTIRLHPDVIQGEEVVITAQRRGQVAAINQQITSQTMVNVVSADRIKELPDANAAEAVGRLPGISLIRSAGEASKIVIRGLEPKLNAITINGIKIPSTSSTDRSVDLTMISSESLEGIEVFKATTPDMDAEAVGGVVNLKIKKAPEEQKMRLKLGPGYNQLAKTYGDYKVTGEYSDRLFDNAIGFVATANYEKVNRSSESFSGSHKVAGLRDSATGIVPVDDNSLSISNSIENRKRMGFGLTIDYVFENGTIWLTNFYSSTNRDPFSISKNYDPNTNDKIIYNIRDQKIKIDGLSNALNGEAAVWGMDMDWVLSSYRIVNDNSYDFNMVFWQSSPFDKTILAPRNLATYIPAAKDDLTKTYLKENFDNPNKLIQTDYAGQYNLKIPWHLNDLVSGFLKAGVKYTQSERDNKADSHGQISYYQSTFVPAAEKFSFKPLIKTSFGLISSENFVSSLTDYSTIVNNKYKLFPLFDRQTLVDWNNSQKDSNYLFDRNSLADSYNLKEALSSGYLMTEIKFGGFLTVITGARFEHENNRYSSVWTSAYEQYGRQCIMRDTTTTRTTDHWFPHLHVKIQAMDGFDIRASANRTIARPDYYWISPWVRFNQQDNKLASGNPSLKESKISNYNITASVYSNVIGLFSVSGYYKDLRDIFYKKFTTAFRPEDYVTVGLPPTKSEPVVWTTYENGDRAQVRGIEIEWQTQLAFFPGMPEFLKGIVFNANFSRIWSSTLFPFNKFEAINVGTSRNPIIQKSITLTKREAPMPGQSEKIINVSLGYDIGNLSTRVSYAFQGSSISAVGQIAEEDIWNKEFTRWDATLKYRFTDWISLAANLVNMSNQPDEAYFGAPQYPTNEAYYGMTGSASLEITF
ncbi:MAG: TonB-dependent receptor [Ignavibacteriales bacterium]|nr:TonB-dependent receptor [Ignavibacteriales bacterium]